MFWLFGGIRGQWGKKLKNKRIKELGKDRSSQDVALVIAVTLKSEYDPTISLFSGAPEGVVRRHYHEHFARLSLLLGEIQI